MIKSMLLEFQNILTYEKFRDILILKHLDIETYDFQFGPEEITSKRLRATSIMIKFLELQFFQCHR